MSSKWEEAEFRSSLHDLIDFSTLWRRDNVQAVEKWLEAHEVRTCRDFGGEEGTNGEGYDFACSACGYCTDINEPNYCPGCGAKVEQ